MCRKIIRRQTISKIARQVTLVTMFSVASRLLAFLFKIYISRKLGAEIVGIFQICLSVFLLFCAIASGGLPIVISRKIAESEVLGNYKKQNKIVSSAIFINIIISVVILIVCYSMGDHLNILFSDNRCLKPFRILLPALVTTSIYGSLRAWFWGKKKYFAYSITELLDNIFKIVFIVCLCFGLTATITNSKYVTLTYTISNTISVVLLFIIFLCAKGRLTKPTAMLEMTKTSAPVTMSHLATSLIASLTAFIIPLQLVASGISQSDATAMFGEISGMALPLIMAPTTITSSLAIVLIPEIAELSTKGDKKNLVKKLEQSIIFSIVIVSFFACIYVPLGQNIGMFLFKNQNAGTYVSQCCIIMIPFALHQVSAPIVNAIGKEFRGFVHYIIGIAIMLPCIFFLPKYIGIYSMAVGSGLCFLLSSIFNLLFLRKHLGKPIKAIKKPSIVIVLSLLPIGITFYIQKLISPHLLGCLNETLANGIIILICGLVATLLYSSLIWSFDIIKLTGFRKILPKNFKFVGFKKFSVKLPKNK